MPGCDRFELMERANFLALVRRIRYAVTKEKNAHVYGLVGAAGFEPTTSLEFNQGALTAELHAYSWSASHRWNPPNQSRPQHLRQGKRHLFPNRDRQPKLAIERAQLRNLLCANKLITVR
jgi:hypothetical protein